VNNVTFLKFYQDRYQLGHKEADLWLGEGLPLFHHGAEILNSLMRYSKRAEFHNDVSGASIAKVMPILYDSLII